MAKGKPKIRPSTKGKYTTKGQLKHPPEATAAWKADPVARAKHRHGRRHEMYAIVVGPGGGGKRSARSSAQKKRRSERKRIVGARMVSTAKRVGINVGAAKKHGANLHRSKRK